MNAKYTTVNIDVSGAVSVDDRAYFVKKSKNIICLSVNVSEKYPGAISFHGSDEFSGLLIYEAKADSNYTRITFSELNNWRIFCHECGRNCIYVTLIRE